MCASTGYLTMMKLSLISISLCTLSADSAQMNQYRQYINSNGEHIWQSTSNFVPVQSTSYGTIPIGNTMSMEFDFIWNGHTATSPSGGMFFRIGADAVTGGNSCNGNDHRYPALFITDHDTLTLYLSEEGQCTKSYDLSPFGTIKQGVSYHVQIDFDMMELHVSIGEVGLIPRSSEWTRTGTSSQFLGDEVPVWWMSNKFGSTMYDPADGVFSNIIIKSRVLSPEGKANEIMTTESTSRITTVLPITTGTTTESTTESTTKNTGTSVETPTETPSKTPTETSTHSTGQSLTKIVTKRTTSSSDDASGFIITDDTTNSTNHWFMISAAVVIALVCFATGCCMAWYGASKGVTRREDSDHTAAELAEIVVGGNDNHDIDGHNRERTTSSQMSQLTDDDTFIDITVTPISNQVTPDGVVRQVHDREEKEDEYREETDDEYIVKTFDSEQLFLTPDGRIDSPRFVTRGSSKTESRSVRPPGVSPITPATPGFNNLSPRFARGSRPSPRRRRNMHQPQESGSIRFFRPERVKENKKMAVSTNDVDTEMKGMKIHDDTEPSEPGSTRNSRKLTVDVDVNVEEEVKHFVE